MPIVEGKTLIGWGVVREDPWHFVGMYETQFEAAAKASDMRVDYTARHGESKNSASFVWQGSGS